VFERFTDPARHVVVFAQDEARELRQNYIGTEHLLLGLLRERDGVAAGALTTLNVTLDDVREQVVQIVGVGDAAESGQIPFTPHAKKALELSLREGVPLGNRVGTEHILLGLVREGDGVACRVLDYFGVDAEKVRNEVARRLR
jgi:ATP-dependent Clp protease ATP-binding subunit ClpC